MRNRDPGDPAHGAHDLDRCVVDEADAVPQDVAVRRADQQGALGNGEGRHGADADQGRLLLAEGGEVGALHCAQRGPGLAEHVHVLALVLADRAAGRWCVARGVLRAAGGADERWHGALLAPPNAA
jgi:hypothetical protein